MFNGNTIQLKLEIANKWQTQTEEREEAFPSGGLYVVVTEYVTVTYTLSLECHQALTH